MVYLGTHPDDRVIRTSTSIDVSETPSQHLHDYGEFGDYVIFVDESGDACLDPISTHFPILNVSFCLIRKDHYIDMIVPTLQALKYRYFGHDQVILHEREMRQGRDAFERIHQTSSVRDTFHADVQRWVAESPFHIVSATVHKERLVERYKHPFDPYHIAMRFCLERTKDFLMRHNQQGRVTQIVFESRGKKADRATDEEFARVLASEQPWGYRTTDFSGTPLEALFISKQANVAGHQLADQIARPLALQVLKPDRPSHLMPCITRKLLAQVEFPRRHPPSDLKQLPNAWQRAMQRDPTTKRSA